jgi:hypothetical protein
MKARIGIKPSQVIRNSVATVSSASIDINPLSTQNKRDPKEKLSKEEELK